MADERKCTLTNKELVEACEKWVDRLCKSGGEAWCLEVPVNFNKYPDMLFTELANRFKNQPFTSDPVSSTEIIVEGNKIDTRDIWDIEDIEVGLSGFRNRHAGFRIKLISGPSIEVYEHIPYERTPGQIREVKEKWTRLEDKVREKWQAGKTELPILKL